MTESFRHEALFYTGTDDFVARTGPFIRDGVHADEPVLVVVGAPKIDMLRSDLGPDADDVYFEDMAGVGQNPARIIPAWREFVDRHAGLGRRLRGIGEPIWAGRSAAELTECARHEALLNLAFADGAALWLACPYDTATLELSVLDEARRNHPFEWDRAGRRPSSTARELAEIARPFDEPLPDPVVTPYGLRFGEADLHDLRAFIHRRAAAAGLDGSRRSDLVLAANEIATNSVRYGGGGGTLTVWEQADALYCEIQDRGRIDDPLAGRHRPGSESVSGYGIWIANQVCDLVQVRSFETGTVVRLQMRYR
ncbi:MAG: sensor histidine kinase [Actinomycetota bacterium]